ncbi:hypothetical protein ABW20_dc0103933 [Dactylellina cionopaga]|nr:hypothetical protein ABW20_dc0103933 [Dactylellina cionopaga]
MATFEDDPQGYGQSLPLEITKLRLSHTSNLIGIDDPTPSISWSYSIPASSRGWQQQTYVLSLRSYKTGDVKSIFPKDSANTRRLYTLVGPKTDRSENIQWPREFPKVESLNLYEISVAAVLTRAEQHGNVQLPLHSCSEFEMFKKNNWSLTDRPIDEIAQKVARTFRGDSSESVVVSSTLRFEAAIIGGIDKWRQLAPSITPITTPWNLENWNRPEPVSIFRNSYHFGPELPQHARIYATAFGVYKIYVNGEAVSDTIMEPGWTEYKLRLLYQTYDVTKHLRSGENVVTVLLADGWYRGRLASGGQARRGVFGHETGFMALLMTSDSSSSERSYSCTGGTGETGWKCTNGGPIRTTEIYDGEHYDSRIKIDGLHNSELPTDIWKPVKVMKDIWSKEKTPILQCSISPPIRCTDTHNVKDIIIAPSGKKILDFGQNSAGRIRLKGSAPAGTKVTFVHVEALQPNGDPCTGILREAKATDSYIFNGSGVEEWEPEFTFHGFRYVQVDPWIDGLEIVAKVYGSDLSRVLDFKSSHTELNRLVENIQWSARANFFSVCTDCPQRDERMGWTGDINVCAYILLFIYYVNCDLTGSK